METEDANLVGLQRTALVNCPPSPNATHPEGAPIRREGISIMTLSGTCVRNDSETKFIPPES